jgi:hypothetical protein
MSITNLKTLIEIFDNFLKDRYAYTNKSSELNLKEIIYETMNTIDENKNYKSLSKPELNKITLSIVKNIVRNKLELGSKSTKIIDRPAINQMKMSEDDMNKQLKIINKTRHIHSEEQNIKLTEPNDSAFSETEFMSTLQKLEDTRNGQIDTFKDTTQNGSRNDIELSKTFQHNIMADQKEIFINHSTDSIKNYPIQDMDLTKTINDRKDFVVLPNKKPEVLKKNLIIDSRERDMIIYPNANDYVIHMEDILRNVCSAELVYALYHKNGTEFYVNLQIDEFTPNMISTNSECMKAFVQLPLVDYINEFTSHRTSALNEFIQPLGKLGKLTIKFKQYNGEYHDIGEHFLKFEIKHFNSIGDVNINEDTNLNFFQNTLQDEIFLARDETPIMNEELPDEIDIEVNCVIDDMISV